MKEKEEYVSRAKAARILGVHPRSIDRYGEGGKLQRYMRLGHIVYNREEVEELDKAVPAGRSAAQERTQKRDWV